MTRSRLVHIGSLADAGLNNVYDFPVGDHWARTRKLQRRDTSRLRGLGAVRALPLYASNRDESGGVGEPDAQSGVIVNVKMDPKVVHVAERMTSIAENTQQAIRPMFLLGAGVAGILLGFLIAKLLAERNEPRRRRRRARDEDDD